MSVDSDIAPSVAKGGYPYGQLFGRSDLNLAASTSVIEGLPDEQRTSPVRRSFLLLILFDLLLCFVLWIVYVQESISTGDITHALYVEVVNYSFRKSLFDTVVLAFLRFLVVEVVYGIFLVKTPWFSGGMTGVTCCVLLSKCFLFDFHQQNFSNTGLAYAVLIAPLVLTWVETTFLICRVIPQEKAAAHVASWLHTTEAEETLSLLGGRTGSRRCPTRYTASAGYFTPQGSVFGDVVRVNVPTIQTREAAVDVAALLNRASVLHSELWYLYRLEIWNPEIPASCEFSVRTGSLPEYKFKIYRLEGVLNAPAQVVYQDLVFNVSQTPSWNTTIENIECIQSLPSENIDVIYNVVHEALGGAISRRDFVLLRTWGEREDLFYIGSTSVEHPKCPPTRNCVRAEQLISACVLEPLPGDNTRSKIVWIMCNDLKLFIPQRIIDRALDSELPKLLRSLQERVNHLNYTSNQLHPLEAHLQTRDSQGERSPRHSPSRAVSKRTFSGETSICPSTSDICESNDRSRLLPPR